MESAKRALTKQRNENVKTRRRLVYEKEGNSTKCGILKEEIIFSKRETKSENRTG